MRTLAQSYAVNVWAERLDTPNPFLENFDPDRAAPLKLPSETAVIPCQLGTRRAARIELHESRRWQLRPNCDTLLCKHVDEDGCFSEWIQYPWRVLVDIMSCCSCPRLLRTMVAGRFSRHNSGWIGKEGSGRATRICVALRNFGMAQDVLQNGKGQRSL